MRGEDKWHFAKDSEWATEVFLSFFKMQKALLLVNALLRGANPMKDDTIVNGTCKR